MALNSRGVAFHQRREFLRRGAALSMAGVATPWALNLAATGEAAAATSVGDYKALVCVFLYGGNDYGNTLVPCDDANYAAYQAIRTGIVLPRETLLPLAPSVALPSGRQMAFAPEWSGLKELFDAGRMGVLLNVGTLMQPTTRAQYNMRSVPLPPKLFSHNDQQSVWQSSLPEGATSGWGGRLGDLFLSSNARTTFTCINVSGNAVFMSGQTAVQYQVGSGGAVALSAAKSPVYGSPACAEALRVVTMATGTHLFESELATMMTRAFEAESQLSTALAGAAPLTTAFDAANPLAMQLKMVARMISVRSALGARRQVFFVSLGGFDLHDFLPQQHPGLLAKVSSAVKSFHDATVELGVANSVTSFTASDFGRTLSSNGDGSDHGWGSHHIVVGGAVKGGRFHGILPATAVNGPDDVGQGRLLPTTSVDQFGAALATWFGVPATDLPLVFPNIGHFDANALSLFA
ncbi:DUF1501 domain-containing protein [Caenimonas soli]|uniref:DUF1501 domain-containing protein n=1 Tax=Caenimonas soli TaxID=2735555 RepID=UPI001551EF6A|nr:DUF1501 domain-containing protein [Caenimonas soli]NPC54734.1 DUF1501 domain-containing protein [Caenimonas soli]